VSRIFLSHSSANAAEAIALRNWLTTLGWDDIFLDLDPERGIKAGERWQAALQSAVDRCEMVICVLSPSWAASKWCLAEFLLAKTLNKRILAAIVEPTPLEDLPRELTFEWQVTDLTAGSRDHLTPVELPGRGTVSVAFSSEGMVRLRVGIERAGIDAKFFEWPPADDPDRPPYRGLLPLETADAGIFYGRDGSILSAIDRIRGLRESGSPRMFIVLGASGAGKSSFLRAGLLPRLKRDDRNFCVLPVIRPDRAALTGDAGLLSALEVAYAAARMAATRADLRSAVAGRTATLRPLLQALVAKIAAGRSSVASLPTLVLPIDQGEELFLADGHDEAKQFKSLLRDLLLDDAPAVLVLLTIRSANYGRLQEDEALADLRKLPFDLAPIPKAAFADIITGPAKKLAGTKRAVEVEVTLVDALLADVEHAGPRDTLPLLAFTLERLYREYRGGGILRLEHYDALGRLKGSIDEAVARALKAAEQDARVPGDMQASLGMLRRGLIPWLAGIDLDSGQPRRRIARYAEIPEESRALIEHLVDERLLTTDADKGTGDTTIEPAHDALLRQWGLLEGWLKEDSGALTTLESLKRAARDWHANARRADWLLHTGARLEIATNVAKRPDLAKVLTAEDEIYLTAAQDAQSARRRRAKRYARIISWGSWFVATIFIILTLSVLHAYRLRLETQGQFVADLAQQKSSAYDHTTAILLALEGLPSPGASTLETLIRPNVPEAEVALYRAYTALTQMRYLTEVPPFFDLQSFALNTDGTRLAVMSENGQGKIIDTVSGKLIATFRPSAGNANIADLSFDLSSSRLIASKRDGTAEIFDANTGTSIATLVGHQQAIRHARFSPDGKFVVTASEDKTARIWDAVSGRLRHVLDGHTGAVHAASFDPTGARVLTASDDGTARLWDAATGDFVASLISDSKYLYEAIFSPDARTIVTTSDKGGILWDAETRKEIRKFSRLFPFGDLRVFSAGGAVIALPNGNGIDIADARTGKPSATLAGGEEPVLSVAFNQDGRKLLSTYLDGTAKVWDVETRAVISILKHSWFNLPIPTVFGSFAGASGRVLTLSAATDGPTFFSVWNSDAPIRGYALTGHSAAIKSAVFSSSGKLVATTSEDHTARVWLAATGREILK
jgi:WD40 repeat protein